jgi:uncharacterized PurR-regulated membrane protein YhhQ (DUF165 family)
LSHHKHHYKSFIYIFISYIIIEFALLFCAYKVEIVYPFIITWSNILIPFWFLLNSVISEVYGSKLANKIILSTLVMLAVIALVSKGSLEQIAMAQSLAIIISSSINSLIVGQLKSTLCNQNFIIRNIGTTCIGEFIFIMVFNYLVFFGLSHEFMIKLLISSYLVNILIGLALILFGNILITLLKKLEYYNNYPPNTSIFDMIMPKQ